MRNVSVLIEGPTAEEDAYGLQRAVEEAGSGAVTNVDIQRSADVLAIVGLVFGAISTADVLWGWWQGKAEHGLKVRVAKPDGTVIELENASRGDLDALLEATSEEDGD